MILHLNDKSYCKIMAPIFDNHTDEWANDRVATINNVLAQYRVTYVDGNVDCNYGFGYIIGEQKDINWLLLHL